MKRILPFLLLVAASETAAQQIAGRVVDPLRRPVVGAAVVLFDIDSTYLSAALSDSCGRFAFASDVRPYRLSLQHLSYEVRSQRFDGDDAGEIVLRERTDTLASIVVEGSRPLLGIEQGRLAYDLGAVVRDKAVGNAYEALARLPGISEERGSLTLAGAGAVAVILNGKPTALSADQLSALLRAMPVERIEKAEVMYSAPPQYRVRGAAINLVLRRSRDYAFSGELHGDYANRHFGRWNAGGNLVVSSPAWSADATYRLGQETTRQQVDLHSRHTFADALYDIRQRQTIVGRERTPKHNLRLAAEYSPEGKSSWSAAYTAVISPDGRNTTLADGSFVASGSRSDRNGALHDLVLRYTSTFGLDLTVDYTRYRTASHTTLDNRYADGSTTRFDIEAGQRVDRFDLTLDRQHVLDGRWSLNYGAAFGLADDSDLQRYALLAGEIAPSDTDSHLREYTGDLYAGFTKQFGTGSFSLSAAGEYYRTGDAGYWAIYPQATLLWMPGQHHLLQISLSSDKSYPSYWEMQQATTYLDGYSEVRGTPGLRPAKSYRGQALYMYRQKYVFLLFWNEQPDYFTQAAWQASDRLALVYQTLNWKTNRQWGANVILPLRPGKWLDMRLTLTGCRMTQRCDAYHDLAFDRSKWIGVAGIDNTLRLSRKPDLVLDLAGRYQSPAIQATYDIDRAWSIDIGAKWRFGKGRATLTARCDDLFESAVPAVRVRYRGQWLDMDTGNHTRTVTLRLSYTLGGYRAKERKEVDTSRFGH